MTEVALIEPGLFEFRDAGSVPLLPGEARVGVHRVGVCGTDIHAFHGRQPFFDYPRVLGHELGVEVLEIHGEADGLRVGARCAVEPYLNDPRSRASLRGRTNCCENLRVLGVHIDGGMRPEMTVPLSKLHVSEVLDFDQLALVEMLCIGAHAIERAGIRRDDFCVVLGAGPIGLSVVQFAKQAAGLLAVVDIDEGRLGFCERQLGIEHIVNPNGPCSLGDGLRALSGGGSPDVVIDATGDADSMAACFDLVANGGRIVFVGLFQGGVTFQDPDFHRKELTLLSSRNAPSSTFARVIADLEAGRVDIRPWITHRLALDEVPDRFGAMVRDPERVKAVIEVRNS